MAEKPANKKPEAPKQALDLNALSGLDFGPNWADENAKPARQKNFDSHGKGQRRGGAGGAGGGGGAPRDRRSGGARPAGRDDRDGRGNNGPQDRSRGRRDGNRERYAAPKPFDPTVKVDLYPQDEAFEALINRLRSSARTYQLFDIAHLLLEKPDRYIVVVSPKPAQGGDSAEPPQLYYSVPGHLPFESEEDAINYVMSNHLDQFFEIEEIEVEAPKGNFPMVNRCTITGERLGPPNYHRYQEFLQRHYAARITGMSFERFTSKVEGVKEQEQIDAWLESMKKGARYKVKDHQEGEPESFETLEAARFFLLQHRKDAVVGSGDSVRFAGRDIERLPKGDIRRSVEAYVENQIHFPLDSANNIRGRLRRHKFAVYKKGSKGVSFVCAVKRKFRDSKTIFTDSIRDLIEFIEKHPDLPASKLPKQYIGIDTEKQKPEELNMSEAEVEAAAKTKAEADAKAEAEAEKAVEAGATSEVAVEVKEEAPAIADDAKASTEATPKVELSPDDEKKLRQLMLDLRWLITEGYVTEYGDGRLFAAPPMPDPKPKAPKPAAKKEPEVKEEAPVLKAGSAAAEEVKVEAEPAAEVASVAAAASEPKLVEEAKVEATPVDEVEPVSEATTEAEGDSKSAT
jgi:hypothetical protein